MAAGHITDPGLAERAAHEYLLPLLPHPPGRCRLTAGRRTGGDRLDYVNGRMAPNAELEFENDSFVSKLFTGSIGVRATLDVVGALPSDGIAARANYPRSGARSLVSIWGWRCTRFLVSS